MDPLHNLIITLQLCQALWGGGSFGAERAMQASITNPQGQAQVRAGASATIGTGSERCEQLLWGDFILEALYLGEQQRIALDGQTRWMLQTRTGSGGAELGARLELEAESRANPWEFARDSRLGPAPFHRYNAALRLSLMDAEPAERGTNTYGLDLLARLEGLRYRAGAAARGPGFDRQEIALQQFYRHTGASIVAETFGFTLRLGRHVAPFDRPSRFHFMVIESLNLRGAFALGEDPQAMILGASISQQIWLLWRDGQQAGSVPMALTGDLYLLWPGAGALVLDLDIASPYPDPATRLWAQRFEARLLGRWTPGAFRFELGAIAGLSISEPPPGEHGQDEPVPRRQRLGLRAALGLQLFGALELSLFHEREALPASWHLPESPRQQRWHQSGLQLRLGSPARNPPPRW